MTMSNQRSQLKMTKLRHSSLDLANADPKKKNQTGDVLSKARNKLFHLSDALKPKKPEDQPQTLSKSMTQCTLDYFFKHSQNKTDDVLHQGSKRPLQKQSSVGSYPQIRVSSFENELDQSEDEVFYPISRLRPATVCVDRPSVDRRSDAEALALERPRKKLSFKEPEVDSNSLKGKTKSVPKSEGKLQNTLKSCEKLLKFNGEKHASDNNNSTFTLGKGIQSIAGLGLSVVTNGVQRVPSCEDAELESQAMRIVRTVGQAFEVCHKLSIGAPEDNFDDEQDTTVTQDLLSDRLSDVASDRPKKEADGDRNSLAPDESSLKDSFLDNSIKIKKPPAHLDILPSPPTSANARKPSPLLQHAETYAAPHSETSVGGSSIPALPPPGSALSAHHEIQLLKEQLEQQRQQTQAAVAQLQLAREQMQAEQTARMEAQTRTHQLLVHNRELLDHIAALVAHLQGSEKLEKPSSPPHMTMPQTLADNQQQQDILQALGNCHSPIRTTFNPAGVGGGLFNLPYPPSPLQLDGSFECQLLQRMGSYPPLNPYAYPPPTPYLTQPYYNQTLMPLQAYATLPRTYSSMEGRVPSSRHSEPRQIYSMQQKDSQPQQQQNSDYQQYGVGIQRRHSLLNLAEELPPSPRRLQVNQDNNQRTPSPKPNEVQFIKPLSQVGTLTTTDSEGRVRVIVPVPSNCEEGDKLSDLRISDELRLMNGPGISRSASERVPNRSELLSQVQRTMWARHTTK